MSEVTTKACTKCGTELPATQEYFYRHKATKDGLDSHCRKCHNAAHLAWAKKNKEANSARAARYRDSHRADYNAYQREYRADPENRAKHAARLAVRNAVRSGVLIRPEVCSCCGKPHDKIVGHHSDYRMPLDVTWCCPTCHRVLDDRRRATREMERNMLLRLFPGVVIETKAA